MTIVLGFGSTEEMVREEVKKALAENGIGVLEKWNSKAEEYDKLPREKTPERYTKIYYYDNTLTFMHINRRHPFSPDGWAMMEIKEPFEIKEEK